MSSQERLGVTYAVLSAVIVGFYPFYYKQLKDVPSVQIVLHRIVWSLLFLIVVVYWRGTWANFRATAFKPKILAVYFASAVSVIGAWLLYVWGVMSGNIIQTSLGFFINPILSVVLAVFVLKEPLRRWQKVAVACATAAVLVVAIAYGKFPWLGVSMALVLSTYGFIKKLAPLGPLDGVFLEISILFLPSLITLIVMEVNGTGAFIHVGATQSILVAGCGVVSTIPLLLFAEAAPMIPFALFGILQYISPTLNFLIGIFVYHEPFSTTKLIGFILVWIALAIFAVDSIVASRAKPQDTTELSDEKSQVKEIIADMPSTPTAEFKAVDDRV
ncbi:unnamed protein product [Aphanomyces euteiches]|uniref:EamA domain-containing protein n=1 Tax=Aphanomyces euteiches TaxID=100861 RepID=A0A6G0WSL0_9STRA|nr:hypothetical protein Ae201684_012111 [Aphanomyces euteiches]KAH9056091.1 hypothetical protein Ae201684P_021829 [Aphanomyces euteiches]KAH9152068.1 hypothetical protein AeRB84_005457 [Aphanomyces euteiches]